MTDSRLERGPMRHIPEDELHSYLDQALSRSQCVEIESHLAECPACQATRDRIAALRDRTTALLARLAPRRRIPVAFELLRREAATRASIRRRRIQTGAWAASLVAALGIGWSASAILGVPATRDNPAAPGPVASADPGPLPAPVTTPQPAGSMTTLPAGSTAVAQSTPPEAPAEAVVRRADAGSKDRRAAPAPTAPTTRRAAQAATRSVRAPERTDSLVAARLAVLNPAPALELSPLEPKGLEEQGNLEGMWRTMSWDGARSEAGERVPHIDGLPVIRVQVQANESGKRPLMVVAQQLASGQVIQTIEGPASDVSQLLSRRAASEPGTALATGDSLPTVTPDQSMAMQVGDRMLAITGALPSDSLRAMIRRINAEMRTK